MPRSSSANPVRTLPSSPPCRTSLPHRSSQFQRRPAAPRRWRRRAAGDRFPNTGAARRDAPDVDLVEERFIEAKLAAKAEGDLMTMDFGALHGGYRADITRTVAITAREVIEAAGHAADFQHGLRHGVGLEIHEAPMLGYGRTGKLTNWVPVTIEPGVYLPAMGGVRIEDVLVVTAGDRARFPTSTTRELLVL